MTTAVDHNDDVALAGEYALHLLDPQERRAFEGRLDVEPALRSLVADWNADFVSLADEIVPTAPPTRLKARIEDVLFAQEKQSGTVLSAWRFFLGATTAAILGLALLLVLPSVELPDGFSARFTAEVAAEDQSLVVQASYAPDTGVLRIDRQSGGARSGRVLELWLIAQGASAPVSLGVLPEQATVDIALPDALVDAIAGGTLAISDEPVGGSTTGAPTGDVLAVGAVMSI